jgi:hypothetical protein
VLCATAAGELVLVGDVFDDAPAFHSRHFPEVGALSLPWADVSEKVVSYNAATLPAGFNFKGSKATKTGDANRIPTYDTSLNSNSKENFLANYFDDASSNIPPVSSIYEDFMGSLLRQQKPDLAVESSTTSLSALIKASKKGKVDAVDADEEDLKLPAPLGKSTPKEEALPHAQTSQKVTSFTGTMSSNNHKHFLYYLESVESNAALFSQMVGAYLKKRPAVASDTAPVTPSAKKSKSSHTKRVDEEAAEEKGEEEGGKAAVEAAPGTKGSEKKPATPAPKTAVDSKTPKKQKK